MLRLKSALLVFVLSILARPSFGADARALDRIFAGKARGETASLLVVLHDQADLAGAAALRGPERRRFVYEALRTAAASLPHGFVEVRAQPGALMPGPPLRNLGGFWSRSSRLLPRFWWWRQPVKGRNPSASR